MAQRKTLILSDSTCDLTDELIKERNIIISPLTIVIDNKQYKDAVDIHPDDIYDYYKKSGNLPKTTASNMGEYLDFYNKNVPEDMGAVCFSISSEMSTNYNNMRLAAAERNGIYAIDSKNLSSGIGLLILYAADLADQGLTSKEIYEKVNEMVPKVDSSFVIDNLEFLHKGGRCTSVAALGANLLKLRPMIQVKDGKMTVTKKYRGPMNKVLKEYVAEKLADKDDILEGRVFITQSGGCEEIADELEAMAKEVLPDHEFIRARAGSTISVHCGPGTLGILFIRKTPLK